MLIFPKLVVIVLHLSFMQAFKVVLALMLFTYRCDHQCYLWVDHAICTLSLLNTISNMYVCWFCWQLLWPSSIIFHSNALLCHHVIPVSYSQICLISNSRVGLSNDTMYPLIQFQTMTCWSLKFPYCSVICTWSTLRKESPMVQVYFDVYLFAKDILSSPSCDLFTAIVRHGYIPWLLRDCVLQLIPKPDKDLKCYRPITLAPTSSKVLEWCILLIYNGFFLLHLFNLATCTDLIENIISRYCFNGSNIFGCFLSASKAFDRVNHLKLN